MRPNEAGDWFFAGYSRFEGLLMGGIHRDGEVTKLTTYAWPTDSSLFNPLYDHATGEEQLPPISGGSDAGGSSIRSPDMATHTPQRGCARATVWSGRGAQGR